MLVELIDPPRLNLLDFMTCLCKTCSMNCTIEKCNGIGSKNLSAGVVSKPSAKAEKSVMSVNKSSRGQASRPSNAAL